MRSLAAETRKAHHRLHIQGPFCNIARGTFTPDDVGLAIALHLRAWRYATSLDDRQYRDSRAQHAYFRLDLLADTASALCAPSLPDLTLRLDDASLEAATYVCLGSQKGGEVLARRLRSAGFGQAAACFARAADHDDLWAGLMSRIDASSDQTFASICAAANRWFESFDVDVCQLRHSERVADRVA